jgi:hypothetical protein
MFISYRYLRHFARYPKDSPTRKEMRKRLFWKSLFSKTKATEYKWKYWRKQILDATASLDACLGDNWRPTSPYLKDIFAEFGQEIFGVKFLNREKVGKKHG